MCEGANEKHDFSPLYPELKDSLETLGQSAVDGMLGMVVFYFHLK